MLFPWINFTAMWKPPKHIGEVRAELCSHWQKRQLCSTDLGKRLELFLLFPAYFFYVYNSAIFSGCGVSQLSELKLQFSRLSLRMTRLAGTCPLREANGMLCQPCSVGCVSQAHVLATTIHWWTWGTLENQGADSLAACDFLTLIAL